MLESVPARSARSEFALRVVYLAPTTTGRRPIRHARYQIAGDDGMRGAELARREIDRTAELLGGTFDLKTSSVPSHDAAIRQAQRVAARGQATAIVGGFGRRTALGISSIARENKLLFVNIGASHPILRNQRCSRYSFHVEASAGQYLDGMFSGLSRRDPRDFYFVADDTSEGEGLHRRALTALEKQGKGDFREVGRRFVDPHEQNFQPLLKDIDEAEPDMVVLLNRGLTQLNIIEQYDLTYRVTGYPYPTVQTPTFYLQLRDANPAVASDLYITQWNYNQIKYSGRSLNSRYREHWGRPMGSPAWASWFALKMLWETVSRTRSTRPREIVEFLDSRKATFDGHKGASLVFRPWNHQLRQPLNLIRLHETAESLDKLCEVVEEIPPPWIDVPQREALQQLGDGRKQTTCRMED